MVPTSTGKLEKWEKSGNLPTSFNARVDPKLLAFKLLCVVHISHKSLFWKNVKVTLNIGDLCARKFQNLMITCDDLSAPGIKSEKSLLQSRRKNGELTQRNRSTRMLVADDRSVQDGHVKKSHVGLCQVSTGRTRQKISWRILRSVQDGHVTKSYVRLL